MSDKSEACPVCGAIVEENVSQDEILKPVPSETVKSNANGKEKKKSLLLIIIIALIAVAAIAVIVLTNNKPTEKEQASAEQQYDTYQETTAKESSSEYDEHIGNENIGQFPNNVHSFSVNGVSFEMIVVEEGTFTMGTTAEQGGDAEDDERPAHIVNLDAFFIGKYEVTQALWKAVMGNNPSYFKGDDLPVEQVSWLDCQEFISQLNLSCADQLNGKRFCLPTEAQWEYAARGGNKAQGYKYSGSNIVGEVAWLKDNSGSKTHIVGTKSPNEIGLYDMSGNVYEWCNDWYGYYDNETQTNPSGAHSDSCRISRGGSWRYNAKYCRTSFRSNQAPDLRCNRIGFRLALCL